MPSFKIKTANTDTPKRRSLLAFLFIPDFGPSIRPIGETTAVFTNLIALLFVMNGLFPKNHPGLARNSKTRLGLQEVLRTAWNNLSFTKDGLPQVLFFFAVVSCMGIVTLAGIIAFCSLFIGKAHAQAACASGGMFTACGGNGLGSTDLAQQFINYLFQGAPISVLDTNTGAAPLSSNIIQCGLYMALGVYSDALLVVAAMILFYHLTWMTVETAHHGQVMGQRGNQIWAPIRLVFAIGLLVPIGGGPAACGAGGAGMNSAQILVVAVAQWGSGLASNVWQQFLNQLANDTDKYVAPPAGPVRKVVQDLMLMYACQWGFNWYIDGRTGANMGALTYTAPGAPTAPEAVSSTIYDPIPLSPGPLENVGYPQPPGGLAPPFAIAKPAATTVAGGTPETKYIFTNQMDSDQPICGSIVMPGEPIIYDPSMGGQAASTSALQDIVHQIYLAQTTALEAVIDNIYYAATGDGGQSLTEDGGTATCPNATPIPGAANVNCGIQYFIPGNPNFYSDSIANLPSGIGGDILNPLVELYQQTLQEDIQGNIAALAAAGDPGMAAVAATSGTEGWMSAGAWFNRVARVQTNLMVAAVNGMPRTMPPDLDGVIAENDSIIKENRTIVDDNPEAVASFMATVDAYHYIRAELQGMNVWLTGMNTHPQQTAITQGLPLATQMELSADELGSSPSNECTLSTKVTDCIFWIVDHLAGAVGVWHSVPTGGGFENLLGVQFTGANPLAEIANYGNATLQLAYGCFDYGILLSFGGGMATGVSQIAGQDIALWRRVGMALGGAAQGAGGILITIGAIFFTLGFLLAYFVPLVPFIAFFFGVIVWIISMLEAVIMAPLVALAHLNPEGDGLPGEMARGGYFLLFQVFLRPVLMVFGLLCGVLVFYLAVAFLNAMFAIAVAGTGGLSNGHFTAARMLYTAIYVILVVVAANHSFGLISRLPNISMQWLGAGGSQQVDIESVAGLENRVTGVGGLIASQAAPQVAQGAGGVGQGVGRLFNPGGATMPGEAPGGRMRPR